MPYHQPTATLQTAANDEPDLRAFLRDFTCTKAKIEIQGYLKTAIFTHKKTGETVEVLLMWDSENGSWSQLSDAGHDYEDITLDGDVSPYDLLDDAIPSHYTTQGFDDSEPPEHEASCPRQMIDSAECDCRVALWYETHDEHGARIPCPGCSQPCESWDEHQKPCR